MHEVSLGKYRMARMTYGFDEISLVPGLRTIDPLDIDLSISIGNRHLNLPILGAAMDGVIDPIMAVTMGKLGAMGVLNLEGIFCRYQDPYPLISTFIQKSREEITSYLQKTYQEPIQKSLIKERIEQIKSQGVLTAASVTPSRAQTLGIAAIEAGLDILVIQSTVTTREFLSSRSAAFDLKSFCQDLPIPVIVGNCATYEVALELMKAGASGILVGIGPGAACTTRAVLGIGIPQITATIDAAAARYDYWKETGRYVTVITDGGMRVGGDVAKAIASGADADMLGSPLASAQEAPGQGHHWGMATPDPNLPRGTLVNVGIKGTLKEILLGPSHVTDGTMNFIGALRGSMGSLGAQNIKEMQQVPIDISPSIWTEGKFLQKIQGVGMGRS